MDIGIILGNIPTSVSEREHFDSILRQAEAAQAAGMNHILIGQHFMFTGSRWFQPVPVLARLAGELDEHVRLCTQIMIGPLYHPVVLAEELATLDVVTGGRLTAGLGIGYLPREYEVLGIPFNQRGGRLSETIEILKLMWTQDSVSYHGKYFQLDDIPVHIKPLQRPHPPIWVGAGSEAAIRRAATLGDAWPITPQVTVDQLPELAASYYRYRTQAGRSRSGHLPLRREIMVGNDRDDALQKAVQMASPWYLNMAATQHNTYVDPEGLKESIPGVMAGHWVLGDAADCATQLNDIASQVPVNPIITRANWPGMSATESVDYIDLLGRELVPAVRDTEPISSM